MEKEVVRKFKNGKMVKVWVRSEGGVIQRLRISGDFFAYPEEGIEMIEKELVGTDCANVRGAIESAAGGILLIGVSVEDLISMIEECLE